MRGAETHREAGEDLGLEAVGHLGLELLSLVLRELLDDLLHSEEAWEGGGAVSLYSGIYRIRDVRVG